MDSSNKCKLQCSIKETANPIPFDDELKRKSGGETRTHSLNSTSQNSVQSGESNFKNFTFDQIESDPETDKCLQFWKSIMENNLKPITCKCDLNKKNNKKPKLKKDIVQLQNDMDLQFWIEAVKELQRKKLQEIMTKAHKGCKYCEEHDIEQAQLLKEIKELNNWKPLKDSPYLIKSKEKLKGLDESAKQVIDETNTLINIDKQESAKEIVAKEPQPKRRRSSFKDKPKNETHKRVSLKKVPTKQELLDEDIKSVDLMLKACTECPCGCDLEFCVCQDLKDLDIIRDDHCKCDHIKDTMKEDDEIKCCNCGCGMDLCLCVKEMENAMNDITNRCNCGCDLEYCLCKTLDAVGDETMRCGCGCGIDVCVCRNNVRAQDINGKRLCDCGCGLELCFCKGETERKASVGSKTKSDGGLIRVEEGKNMVCSCGCGIEFCVCESTNAYDQMLLEACKCDFKDDDNTSVQSKDDGNDPTFSVGVQCQLLKAGTCKKCTH